MSLIENREWPPRFRQDELAGMMMPGPDPTYLEKARKLARTAALAEVLSAQVDAYPMDRELGILQVHYLEEHLELFDEAKATAEVIGADVDTVFKLARAEVERLTGSSLITHPYDAYAKAQMIIRGKRDEWEEAA